MLLNFVKLQKSSRKPENLEMRNRVKGKMSRLHTLNSSFTLQIIALLKVLELENCH